MSRLKLYPRNIGPHGRLSPRQREVAQLIANGYTCEEISSLLGIEKRTVQYHLHGAMERFRTGTVPFLIYKMIRWGELPPGRELTIEQIRELRAVPYAYTSPEMTERILAGFAGNGEE